MQLRAALSLELFAGIDMDAQGFLMFHVFLDNECTQAKMTMIKAANTNTVSLNLSPFFIVFTSKINFEEVLEDKWESQKVISITNMV